MSADDSLFFIDANKYLDLYGTNTGKKLLAPLGEQVGYIFVTQQVVAEVQRNKISVAARFLGQTLSELKLRTFNVPDHLSGTTAGQGEAILNQMGDIVQMINKTNAEVDALASGIVEQISRSEDEVSKALAPIFAKGVPHSDEELQRARNRRELGHPPGKVGNALGDQLTWEQILTHFKGKKRLWIISRDGDYGTVYNGKGFLNRFLYDELCARASAPEVYLFEDTVEGIEHFVKTTGVKAEKRLTPEEAKEVKKEEKSLANFGVLSQEYYRWIAELANPSEQVRKIMAAAFAHPSEQVRIMAALAYPSEQIREAMDVLALSGEQTRRALAATAALTVPSAPQKDDNGKKGSDKG